MGNRGFPGSVMLLIVQTKAQGLSVERFFPSEHIYSVRVHLYYKSDSDIQDICDKTAESVWLKEKKRFNKTPVAVFNKPFHLDSPFPPVDMAVV